MAPSQDKPPTHHPDRSKLCENCGSRGGFFHCQLGSVCHRYGSKYAHKAKEQGIAVDPRDTGRRCEDCLTISKTYCGECKTFQCFVCAEVDYKQGICGSKFYQKCSYCHRRVCREYETGCFWQCTKWGSNHKVVLCKGCLNGSETLRKNWTQCLDCAKEGDSTAFQDKACCPSCKNGCPLHQNSYMVNFAGESIN